MSNTNIGISDQDMQGVAGILSQLLADEYVLYTKTRNYHWNVVGPHFNDLHKFFEGQYDQLADDIDDIAERIRSLGSKTPATLSEFGKNSRLDEHPGEYPDANSMVSNLVLDHETIIKNLRTDLETCDVKFHDVGTIGLAKAHPGH